MQAILTIAVTNFDSERASGNKLAFTVCTVAGARTNTPAGARASEHCYEAEPPESICPLLAGKARKRLAALDKGPVLATSAANSSGTAGAALRLLTLRKPIGYLLT